MYDTVNFRLMKNDVEDVDFLSEIPCFLQDVGEHRYRGDVFMTGSIQGYKVTVGEYQLKVKDHSLCKFLLGDNYKTMSRRDAGLAVEKLSDFLHVPMQRAVVTRLDVAHNFVMRYPVGVYFNHLGELGRLKRLQMGDGLYYKSGIKQLCLYDKNKEQRGKGEPVPELYKGRNVLRMEQRYLKRITQQLGDVTGASLSDRLFFSDIVNRLSETYESINKINDFTINIGAMAAGKKELNRLGVLALVERAGGQINFLNQIKEAQQMGLISNYNACIIKKAVKAACKVKPDIVVQSDAIEELNRKVREAKVLSW